LKQIKKLVDIQNDLKFTTVAYDDYNYENDYSKYLVTKDKDFFSEENRNKNYISSTSSSSLGDATQFIKKNNLVNKLNSISEPESTLNLKNSSTDNISQKKFQKESIISQIKNVSNCSGILRAKNNDFNSNLTQNHPISTNKLNTLIVRLMEGIRSEKVEVNHNNTNLYVLDTKRTFNSSDYEHEDDQNTSTVLFELNDQITHENNTKASYTTEIRTKVPVNETNQTRTLKIRTYSNEKFYLHPSTDQQVNNSLIDNESQATSIPELNSMLFYIAKNDRKS